MSHSTHQPPAWIHVTTQSLLGILLVALPLLVFPFTLNVFDMPKFLSIYAVTALIFVLWAGHQVLQKKVTFRWHPFVLPSVALLGSIFLSTALTRSPLIELNWSLLGAIVALGALIIIAPSVLKPLNRPMVIVEIFGVVAVALLSVGALQVFGVGPSRLLSAIAGINFAHDISFSLAGSPLVVLSLFVALALGSLIALIGTRPKKLPVSMLITGILGAAASVFFLFFIAPGRSFQVPILSLNANWIMGAEMAKSVPRMMVGVGPTRFVDAYTAFRPVSTNAGESWSQLFQVGTNVPLTLFIQIGLLGVIAWALFFLMAVRMFIFSPAEQRLLGGFVLGILITQLLFPPNLILWALLAIFIALWMAQLTHLPVITHQQTVIPALRTSLSALLVLVIAVSLVGIWGYYSTKNVLAEEVYFRSLKAAQQNDGNLTYQLQQEAIRWNPQSDLYHRAYAQTNFALANSLSTQENLTDEQRQTITQLLQQAIRESRLSAQLQPNRSLNWQNVAQIYRELIGVTEGADQWSVAAYVRAIQTNPHNPILRLELGGVFFRLENYGQAEQLFTQAAQLKPDMALAFYNLAKVYEKQSRLPLAQQAYQRALQLLDPSSEDYIKAQQDLAKLTDQIEAASSSAQPKQTNEEQESLQDGDPQPQEAELSEELEERTELLSEEPTEPVVNTPNPSTTPAASASPSPSPEVQQ